MMRIYVRVYCWQNNAAVRRLTHSAHISSGTLIKFSHRDLVRVRLGVLNTWTRSASYSSSSSRTFRGRSLVASWPTEIKYAFSSGREIETHVDVLDVGQGPTCAKLFSQLARRREERNAKNAQSNMHRMQRSSQLNARRRTYREYDDLPGAGSIADLVKM